MKFLILLTCSFLVTGCATKSFDYTLFKAHHPKSILVLPPTTASTDLKSSYSCLSTATLPIAEMGYYVFPVGVVDEFLKSNGMTNPAEMHQVSLKKIDEIIHPDAVMYTHIEEYGTKFHIITSSSTVAMKSRLVDIKTTKEIWNGEIT